MSAKTPPAGAAPPPEALAPFDRLRLLLREMFQLDRGDLDFGLYRIMNLKAKEVGAFLEGELLPQVKQKLNLTTAEDLARVEEELESDQREASRLGFAPESAPKVKEHERRIAGIRRDISAEADVYHHLANFFARYYSEGDFVSQRRYSSGGRSAYLIPYDGEEVKLHWANADQYYIKTAENYAAYAFTVPAGEDLRRVRFETASAANARDTIKDAPGRQRRFVPAGTGVVAMEAGELLVRFEHRPLTSAEKKRWPGNGSRQQSGINEAAAARILRAAPADWGPLLAAPAPTEANGERTLLRKHLDRFTAKNTFDYFVHKDLGGFLRGELDRYLNTEVLLLDDLEQGDPARLDRALARVRAIRHIGGKIIAFLAQLEDFQKRLWLKKKLVLETGWCVTLDRAPESLWPEIAANDAQRREWVALFAINEIRADLGNGLSGYSEPLRLAFLKANPHLVLDTRHFDADFTDRLLEALSDAAPLDEQTDGLLVHGENFQALNLLSARYLGQVQCVYIDPPYNTNASPILYKNDYKDSSWLALTDDRLRCSKALLGAAGVICCAIDDEEASLLRILLRSLFERELGIVAVRSNPAGRKSQGRFSPVHEYAMFFGMEDSVPGSLRKTQKELARYPYMDSRSRYAWNNLIRHGSNDRREDRPKLFFPIYVTPDDRIRIPGMEWNETRKAYDVREEPREDEVALWPVRKQNGTIVEKNWHRGPISIREHPDEYRVRRTCDEGGTARTHIDFKIRMDPEAAPGTWWDDARYASANRGPKELKALFGDRDFDFPKAVGLVEDCVRAGGADARSVVLDYFAGSGTTGHAVINLNREDGGDRKYILVEMADHFDTSVLPRIKKVVYAPDWKGGRPVSRKGVSQLVKYIRLESYEDTMDSLEHRAPSPEQEQLLAGNPALAEDYRLRYALGVETAGSVSLLGKEFRHPFACTLSVVRDGARREVAVDLPETFNYLLGLRVEGRQRIEGVLAITGRDQEERRCLILWRDLDRLDHAGLDRWFDRHCARFAGPPDVIYTNGDHTLNAMRKPGDSWVAETLDPVFRERMFEEGPR